MELAALLRDVNNKTDRRALKIELDKLYEKATEEDGKITEMFVNLVTKLPKFQRLSSVGEIELTVNFLDPILSHIFHCPDSNKHLMWLNRQDDSTTVYRPDAAMVALPQKAENVTLGYVEVKSSDAQSDLELASMDLVRLGTFARSHVKKIKPKGCCDPIHWLYDGFLLGIRTFRWHHTNGQSTKN